MSFYVMRKGIRKLPGIVIKAVDLPDPVLTQGFGSREQVGEICKQAGYESVLVVTDKTLYSLGFYTKVTESLEDRGIRCTVFSDIDSEPTIEIIEAGRLAAIDCYADCIVALGGGSVLDSCKIIAACAKHPQWDVQHYLHKFALVKDKTLPMITIPSTAGTGAEYTVGAVVKNAHGVKNSTVVVGLNVVQVILDSELTVGTPKSVTVWCAIDTLSHGLEGLLADVASSDDDILKSKECVKLVFENLPVLLDEPQNIEARQNMSLAAHYGGNAINTQLAGYVHAFAHSIGALYHIPHGKAIAHCLIPVITEQLELCAHDLAALAVYCGFAGESDDASVAADAFMTALKHLLDQCGLEQTCAQIREEDYTRLIHMIDNDSINYSPPKTFSDKEIIKVLDQIRTGR